MGSLKIKTDKHSRFSPSSAYRWTECPGSVSLIEECKELGLTDEPSEYALEGIEAHNVASAILQDWFNNELVDDETETDEMVKYAHGYLDYILGLFPGRTMEMIDCYIEKPLEMSSVSDEIFGTADFVAVDHLKETVHVVDYKYGKGVPVSAKRNLQLILYGIGVLDTLNLESIRCVMLHIYQPRILTHEISTEILTRTEISYYRKLLKHAVLKCGLPSSDLVPDDKACRWCPAKPKCPALHQLFMRVWRPIEWQTDLYRKYVEGEADLTDLSFVLRNRKLVESYLDEVQRFVTDRMKEGVKFEDMKLVHSRTQRRYTADAWEVLAEYDRFSKEIAETKLKTISQLEKVVPSELLEKITYKPEPNLVAVPIEDKRPEAVNVNIDDFEDLTK